LDNDGLKKPSTRLTVSQGGLQRAYFAFHTGVARRSYLVAGGASGQPDFRDAGGFHPGAVYEQWNIDSTFGSNEEATTALGTKEAAIYGLTIQTDRRIVAVGTSLAGNQAGGLVVAHYFGQ
jgi:hypothetical protein